MNIRFSRKILSYFFGSICIIRIMIGGTHAMSSNRMHPAHAPPCWRSRNTWREAVERFISKNTSASRRNVFCCSLRRVKCVSELVVIIQILSNFIEVIPLSYLLKQLLLVPGQQYRESLLSLCCRL